jgi:hypothetical protein
MMSPARIILLAAALVLIEGCASVSPQMISVDQMCRAWLKENIDRGAIKKTLDAAKVQFRRCIERNGYTVVYGEGDTYRIYGPSAPSGVGAAIGNAIGGAAGYATQDPFLQQRASGGAGVVCTTVHDAVSATGFSTVCR